jgi:uncharacterized protein
MSYGQPEYEVHGQSPPPPPPSGGDERTWAMICHLSTFAGYAIPFGNIVGPLAVWLIKRHEMPLVDDQGKEALNFQISVLIYLGVCIPLMIVVVGFFLAIAVVIFSIVVTIIAAMRANEGIAYRYPLTIRFIS